MNNNRITFNSAVTQIAINEWIYFGRNTTLQDGRQNDGLKEIDSKVFHRIFHYWKYSVNKDFDGKNTNWPWSAAFISFCFKFASAITDQESPLRFSTAHSVYINEAFKNREKDLQKAQRPYLVGYYLDEVKPEVGDLIGGFRGELPENLGIGENGKCVKNFMQNVKGFYESHCDLVTHKKFDSIFVIGGNVDNSVDKSDVALDEEGYLDSKKYSFLLRSHFPEPKVLI